MPSRPLPIRRPWLAPVAASAAVLAAGVGMSIGLRNQPANPPGGAAQATSTRASAGSPVQRASQPGSSSATSASSPTSGTSHPTSSTVDGSGPRELPARQIPWSAVQTGWAIATYSVSEDNTRVTAYLISPDGARYPVATLTDTPQVIDVSPDGHRALLITRVSGTPGQVRELDLTTGAVRTLYKHSGPGTIEAGYADAPGSAVLIAVHTEAETTVARWSNTGAKIGPYGTYPGRATILPTVDGTALWVGTAGKISLHAVDGTLVKAVANPTGMSRCEPLRWYDGAHALIGCTREPEDAYAVQYTLTLEGVSAQVTTSVDQPTGPAADWVGTVGGQWQAWSGPGGEQLATRGTGCQTGEYVRGGEDADRGADPIGTVRGADDDSQAIIVSVTGSTAHALVGCVETRHSLALLNTTTMTPSVVLGMPVTNGFVHDVRVVGASQWAIGLTISP